EQSNPRAWQRTSPVACFRFAFRGAFRAKRKAERVPCRCTGAPLSCHDWLGNKCAQEVMDMSKRPRTKAAKKRRVRLQKERRLRTAGVNTLLFRKVKG